MMVKIINKNNDNNIDKENNNDNKNNDNNSDKEDNNDNKNNDHGDHNNNILLFHCFFFSLHYISISLCILWI